MWEDHVKKIIVLIMLGLLLFSSSFPLVSSKLKNSNEVLKDIENEICSIRIITVPDDYLTIQGAIDHAMMGDQIKVKPGTYWENIVVNIMIDIIGSGKEVTIIDGSGKGNVVTIYADGVTFSDFTIQNSGSSNIGMDVSSHYNIIEQNKITKNYIGLTLDVSSGNIINNNLMIDNDVRGFWLYRSHANTITNNTISGNGNQLTTSMAYNAQADGILLNFSCIGNIFKGNIIEENGRNGVTLSQTSRSNTFSYNRVSGNNNYGVNIVEASDSNILYHNQFTKNSYNSNDAAVNTWSQNNEGNYWGDYSGNDTNSDDIGDTPYVIPGGGNNDPYPLMVPVFPNPPKITGPDTINIMETESFHINTTEKVYDEVYYQIWWDDGLYWETSADLENTTIGIDESHMWKTKGSYMLRSRAFVDMEGVRLTSEDSDPLPLSVPKNKQHKQSSSLTNILVVPRDYPSIQAAIDSASNGDAIRVWTGTYYENIFVNKSIKIIGNGSDLSVIHGVERNNVVVTIAANESVVSGFTIKSGDFAGVWMENKINCNVSNNRFIDNRNGFYVFYCQDAIIENNDFIDCGLGFFGNEVNHFLHTVIGNTVDDKEVLYMKNSDAKYLWGKEKSYGNIILVNCTDIVVKEMITISGGEIGVQAAFCRNVTIKDSMVKDSDFGVYLIGCKDEIMISNNDVSQCNIGLYAKTSQMHFEENDVSECTYGIELWESNENNILGNNINNNSNTGVYLHWADENIIDNNIIRENVNGVDVFSSQSNSILNNFIVNNSYDGLFLKNSSENSIMENTINNNGFSGSEENVHNGITLKQSNNNIFIDNTIAFNEFWGIFIIDQSDQNRIYHNIFWYNGHFWDDDKHLAYDECHNTWDNGYPDYWNGWMFKLGDPWCGNYWSDHDLCVDRSCGPNQDEIGEDNICDIPYSISEGRNFDRYPTRVIGPDDDPPIISFDKPLPGHCYLFNYPIDWPIQTTYIIGPFRFKVNAYEPTNEGWQSNFVKVKFELINMISGKHHDSGWIEGPPFSWGMENIHKSLSGSFLLRVYAKDTAENYADELEMNIVLMRGYSPWI
jgi:parallel beta-helix repeat protein